MKSKKSSKEYAREDFEVLTIEEHFLKMDNRLFVNKRSFGLQNTKNNCLSRHFKLSKVILTSLANKWKTAFRMKSKYFLSTKLVKNYFLEDILYVLL